MANEIQHPAIVAGIGHMGNVGLITFEEGQRVIDDARRKLPEQKIETSMTEKTTQPVHRATELTILVPPTQAIAWADEGMLEYAKARQIRTLPNFRLVFHAPQDIVFCGVVISRRLQVVRRSSRRQTTSRWAIGS